MPSASANIIAKFNAQMLTGAMWVASTRAPAAVSSPTSVSISGRPAATRLPKAMTSTIIVTGQDSTSELIIAAWLTLLKFAHSALSPVRSTETLPRRQPRDRPVQGVGRAHHLVRVCLCAGLDDRGLPVACDSADARAGARTTVLTRESALQQRGGPRDCLLGGGIGSRSVPRCRAPRPAAPSSRARRSSWR